MTLTEATQGKKLRAMPPRFGDNRGPWKPAEFSLRNAEREYRNSGSTWRRAWYNKSECETFANAHARRHDQLRNALLEYTRDPAFVANAFRSEAWQYPEANERALECAQAEHNAAV